MFECNLKVTYLPMVSNNQSDFGWQVDGKKWRFSVKIFYIYLDLLRVLGSFLLL